MDEALLVGEGSGVDKSCVSAEFAGWPFAGRGLPLICVQNSANITHSKKPVRAVYL